MLFAVFKLNRSGFAVLQRGDVLRVVFGVCFTIFGACSSPDATAPASSTVRGKRIQVATDDARGRRVRVAIDDIDHVTVTTGTELDVATFNIPVLPETMALRLTFDADAQHLEFLRQEPAEGEGSMLQHLIFRVRTEGNTVLRVRLVDSAGNTHQADTLRITATDAAEEPEVVPRDQ